MLRADRAMLMYELSGYLRGKLPYRFVTLLPMAVFLAAWTWGVSSPLASVIWIVAVSLEPRINNAFFGSPRELEALSLLPADWSRITLLKNLSTLIVGAGAIILVSIVSLYFSPGTITPGQAGEFLFFLPTVCFKIVALGNESSVRYPRRNPASFSAGLAEALWMTVVLVIVSVPYFIIMELAEAPWLCWVYAAASAAAWYFRSIPRTAARITNRNSEIWRTTDTSSNS